MIRAVVVVLAAGLALWAGPARAADQRLAVLDVDGGAVKPADRAKATAALRTGAESAIVDPRITIVAENAQRKALKRARRCTQGPTLCARDAGKAIGATLVLAARLEKAGKQTTSNLWLVDVDTGAVLAEDLVAGPAKAATAGLQRRAAAVVAAGLRAKEPKPAAPKPAPVVAAPPPKQDEFIRTFTAMLVGPQGTVNGIVTLTARALAFEPTGKDGLQAWEQVPLTEVTRLEKFNHMMMLPAGVAVSTTTGKSIRLVFSDDRDRIFSLIQTRVDMAKAPAAPNPPSGG